MYGLDLFSGIGGITKALEPWVRPVAYCENDRYAQAVLLSRMATGELPSAPIWDDVRTLHGSMLGPVDIVYGGFPCQDISVAGRGKGLAGERSGLFFEIVRLVGEIRPRFVFLENVPAITARGGWEVVGALAALGFDCRWDMLSAYDVGAPHRRERWWLLAHAQGWQDDGRGRGHLAETVGEGRRINPTLVAGSQDVADASGQPVTQKDTAANAVGSKRKPRHDDGRGDGTQTPRNGWWVSEPNVGRVAYGIPARVDRLRGLGNTVVPAQAREAFKRLSGLRE
jgi:DNA (cytosine-5)-methyltransferase 1